MAISEMYELVLLRDLILQGLSKLPGGMYLQNKYIFSLLTIISFVILAKIIQYIATKYVERIAKKTATKLDDLILEKASHPFLLLVIGIGLKLAVINLNIDGITSKIVDSLLALTFLLLVSRSVDVAIEAWGEHFARKTRTKIDEVLLPLFHKADKVIFVLIGFMWVLHLWNIDITPYLAGVGISGLVLGFALQDSLKNVFGGISLILDKTYKLGDRIQLDSGEVGRVHDIGLRSTKLITLDNQVIFVPNGYLSNSRVINFAQPDAKIRLSVDFGAVYGTRVEKVRELIFETVSKIKGVLKEPAPSVLFLQMGDSALKFRVNFWVDKYDLLYGHALQSEATEAIYDALNKAKIGIPFPTQTIYIKKEE